MDNKDFKTIKLEDGTILTISSRLLDSMFGQITFDNTDPKCSYKFEIIDFSKNGEEESRQPE